MGEINLHDTLDAQIWAKEFMKIHEEKLHLIDEDLMASWFANSIMCGYDHRVKKEHLEPSDKC